MHRIISRDLFTIFFLKMHCFKIIIIKFWAVLLVVFAVLALPSCQPGESEPDFINLRGETMGTMYSITSETDISAEKLQTDIDSLLIVLNDQLSTYIPESTISRFNQADSTIEILTADEPFFVENLMISKRIFGETDGMFDPTVMPLVNYWGFGYTGHEAPEAVDSAAVDSLLKKVGFDKVDFSVDEYTEVTKNIPGVELDFSAVAKGYAVDVVANYLAQNEVNNYLVDIGGEVCVQGSGRRGSGWVLGVSTPDPTADGESISQRLRLDRGCVATSGNYRNFRMVDDRPVGHTINPRTGFPEMNNLLSVTIWTSTAAAADAYATACLVADFPAAKELIEGLEGVEGYFIYLDEEGEVRHAWTGDFSPLVVEEELN